MTPGSACITTGAGWSTWHLTSTQGDRLASVPNGVANLFYSRSGCNARQELRSRSSRVLYDIHLRGACMVGDAVSPSDIGGGRACRMSLCGCYVNLMDYRRVCRCQAPRVYAGWNRASCQVLGIAYPSKRNALWSIFCDGCKGVTWGGAARERGNPGAGPQASPIANHKPATGYAKL